MGYKCYGNGTMTLRGAAKKLDTLTKRIDYESNLKRIMNKPTWIADYFVLFVAKYPSPDAIETLLEDTTMKTIGTTSCNKKMREDAANEIYKMAKLVKTKRVSSEKSKPVEKPKSPNQNKHRRVSELSYDSDNGELINF